MLQPKDLLESAEKGNRTDEMLSIEDTGYTQSDSWVQAFNNLTTNRVFFRNQQNMDTRRLEALQGQQWNRHSNEIRMGGF